MNTASATDTATNSDAYTTVAPSSDSGTTTSVTTGESAHAQFRMRVSAL